MTVNIEIQSGDKKWGVRLDPGGPPHALPESLQPPGPFTTTIRAVAVGDTEDRWHPAIEEIAHAAASISWTGTHRDFGQAAASALDAADLRNSAPDRDQLVRAAGFIVAAIAAVDAQAPVEVRRDDLRNLLDRAFIMNVEEDEAVSRLRDALEGPR